MELKSISPSSMNRFENCPRKWKLHELGKVGIAVPEAPRLYGTAIHNCIVIYFDKISDKPTTEDIEVTAREAFEEGTTHAMKGFKARTKQILDNFIEFEKKRLKLWKQYKPTFVEKWNEAKVFEDIPPFRIIVDFYGEADATVIDWKSGKSKMGQSNLRQGKINEMVLRKLGHEVKRVTFFGLENGTNLQVPRVTDGWIYKLAKRMVDMARAERFPKNPSGLCPWCEWQLRCQLDDVCIWEGI